MEATSMATALGDCGFFEGLEPRYLAQVADRCSKERFDAGQEVFRQGELGQHLYLVCEGGVTLERTTDLGSRQGRVAVALLDPGKLFGAWGVLLGREHRLMTSAVCKRAATVAVLDGRWLRDLISADRELGCQILERLGLLLRDRLANVLVAMETL